MSAQLFNKCNNPIISNLDFIFDAIPQKIMYLSTDTDSLLFRVETENLYEDLIELKDELDTFIYSKDNPLHSIENKARYNFLGT